MELDVSRMVDIQDRRYLAQCTQQLSSGALAELLDMLLKQYPAEVVERKGGESYHIDFGTLSTPAYADVREFVKKSLGSDDDFGFSESFSSPAEAVSGFGGLKGPEEEDESEDGSRIKKHEKSLTDQRTKKSASREPSPSEKLSQVSGRNRQVPEKTPPLAQPSAGRPGSREQSSDGGSDVPSFSPEKSGTRLKRQRLSSEDDKKEESSRYYNGERVWRHASDDLHFSFHGIDVKLLSLKTDTKRPWKCGVCEKAFVSKDKIVNHVQQHSGEKIHECPICHGKFSSKHYLKEHQKRVHLFNCHHCDETFETFDELHAHSLEAHPDHAEVKGCSCKKGCNNSRCSCFKNGLNCTASCQCDNCNNTG